MKFVLIFALLILALAASAQPGPDTLWTRFYGWTGDDTAFSIKQTADAGFIIAGTGTVPATGYANAFLIKTDSNGVMQGWHSYGGDNDDGFYSVEVAYDGGYAMTGYSSGDSGYRGIYFVRVNAFGDTVCTLVYPCDSPWHCWGTSLVSMANNDFAFAGMARASGYPDAQGLGLWFPALGCNYIWDFGLYADGGINIHAVHQTSDGSLVIVGAYADTVGLTPEALLWKVTLDPPSEIFRLIGDQSHEDDAYDFVETPTGYLLAGSTYDGQMNGLFLTKTDTDGNPEWIHRFTSQFVDQWAEAIIPANGGGYVIAGTTGTYLYGTDMLLVKVNDDGDIVWQKNYGSDVDERAYDVVQTSDGGFVLVGYSTAHQGVGAEWYIVKTLPDPDLATPEPSLSLPQQFTLSAFPNPFNPATNLTFSLPQSNHVSLSVYDMGGRLVKNLLVNQLYSAGEHHFGFDASALPSGIYFARVHAGNFVKTQKLLLLK